MFQIFNMKEQFVLFEICMVFEVLGDILVEEIEL